MDAHLARLQLVDLVLDTFPYTGHTTTSDMIRMGVPVVTRTGQSFAARVAGGLLACCGLDDLVARDARQYEEIALRLALDPAERAAMRQRVRDAAATGPLFQPAALCAASGAGL